MAKILLVDDNAALLAAMVDFLQPAGHQTTLAANGKEAIGLVNANHFDLVITDLFMPEKEGLETILDLRKQFPTMKIIAMSGSDTDNAVNNLYIAHRFGAVLTLNKPFSG